MLMTKACYTFSNTNTDTETDTDTLQENTDTQKVTNSVFPSQNDSEETLKNSQSNKTSFAF